MLKGQGCLYHARGVWRVHLEGLVHWCGHVDVNKIHAQVITCLSGAMPLRGVDQTVSHQGVRAGHGSVTAVT